MHDEAGWFGWRYGFGCERSGELGGQVSVVWTWYGKGVLWGVGCRCGNEGAIALGRTEDKRKLHLHFWASGTKEYTLFYLLGVIWVLEAIIFHIAFDAFSNSGIDHHGKTTEQSSKWSTFILHFLMCLFGYFCPGSERVAYSSHADWIRGSASEWRLGRWSALAFSKLEERARGRWARRGLVKACVESQFFVILNAKIIDWFLSNVVPCVCESEMTHWVLRSSTLYIDAKPVTVSYQPFGGKSASGELPLQGS
jgi:hypothetical protein